MRQLVEDIRILIEEDRILQELVKLMKLSAVEDLEDVDAQLLLAGMHELGVSDELSERLLKRLGKFVDNVRNKISDHPAVKRRVIDFKVKRAYKAVAKRNWKSPGPHKTTGHEKTNVTGLHSKSKKDPHYKGSDKHADPLEHPAPIHRIPSAHGEGPHRTKGDEVTQTKRLPNLASIRLASGKMKKAQ